EGARAPVEAQAVLRMAARPGAGGVGVAPALDDERRALLVRPRHADLVGEAGEELGHQLLALDHVRVAVDDSRCHGTPPSAGARRSCASAARMMGRPPFTAPTTFSAGTRTSSKKSWLNSERPLSCTSGRQVMPGVRMSTTRQLMPACFGASGPVRTRSRHQSAKCALLDHTFCPLTTQWSPSRRARQRSEARSEPAFGSEKPRHQTWSAGRMGGSQRACCAGVPKRMRVGPTMLTLTGSRISGARARAISSVKM